MTAIHMNEDEWYAARDDRTKRLDDSSDFEDFSLGVIVGPDLSSDFATQAMALVSSNILARWCRNITVQMQEATSVLPGRTGVDFKAVVEKVMEEADPYGEFTFSEVSENDLDGILFIGKPERKFKKPHVWIDGSGWVAGVGHGVSSNHDSLDRDSNPIGPAFAACLGVSEIFKIANGSQNPDPYSAWYSMYDFGKTSDDPRKLLNPEYVTGFDFGRVYQVGCGAVGSSLDFLLSLTEWNAELHLIDFDKVDSTNCNRSLSFSVFDAISQERKIDSCAGILKNTKINPITFDGDYGDFISRGRYMESPPDLILSLANERNVWSDIQENYPPLVFHATTTSNWGLNFGRHTPKKEWCIWCRFSKEGTHRFVPPCSVSEISKDEKEEPVLGALPFLSPASAILLMAEMAKIPMEGYPVNGNFVEFSMKPRGGGMFSKGLRKPSAGCICNEQPLDIYPEQIKKSKFWRK